MSDILWTTTPLSQRIAMKSDEENRQNVTVTDIHMPFSSMVVFMVKWAIAAIPAFIILTAIGIFTWSILGGLLHSWTLSNEAIKIGSEARTPFPTEESACLGKIIVKGVTVGPTTLEWEGSPLTLCKRRQNGNQRITVQYVNVSNGSQAVLGDVVKGGKQA